MTRLWRNRSVALMVLLVVLAMVAAACTSDSDDTTTTTAAAGDGGETTTTVAATETTEATDATDATTTTAAAAATGFTYTLGMTSDIVSNNYWAYIGPDGTVYMQYVFGPTKPSLFTIQYPGLIVAPDVAVGLPAEPVEEGDVWTITQSMRPDYVWSDGSPLTAHDVVFTYTTVRDAGLGGDWISAYPYTDTSEPQLTNVEAVDDYTVKYTYASFPGGAVWPHNTGVASIMPKAPWEAIVTEALASEDPGATIYGADAFEIGDLSGGPVNYNGREEGAFVENVANTAYSNAGMEHIFYVNGSYEQNGQLYFGEGGGDVLMAYKDGPFLDRTAFSIYGDQAAAMLALADGEIDYWINPLGVSPGLRQQGLEAENLDVAVNPTNGFRYLAFNLRKSPGKFLEYRQALAYMIDKEFLTLNVLQGVAFPLYVLVPEGNQAWYNAEFAEEVAAKYVGLDENTRLQLANEVLVAGGFTWETDPVTDEDGVITPGVGLIDPDGVKLVQQEIMAPPASYDPLRATAALWIEGWMEKLGIDAKANPTDFNTIVAKVWPGIGEEITFDTYILGWSLGNPAWPTFHESFFHTRHWAETDDGGNATGYSDPEFDQLADDMFALKVSEQDAAYDKIWEMEAKLVADLPYIVLFDTPITEFFTKDVSFPFTSTLSGIQALAGMQGNVAK